MLQRARRAASPLLFALGLALVTPCSAAPDPVLASTRAQKILVINSYHWGFRHSDDQIEGMLSALRASTVRPEVYVEQMDVLRERRPFDDAAFLETIRTRLRGHRFDLVVEDEEAEGRLLGQLAMRVLRGEDPRRIPAVGAPVEAIFHYRHLVDLGIPDSALPTRSIIVGRPPNFLADHREVIVATVAVITVLLVALSAMLLNIRRRVRVEAMLRESEERFRFVLEGTSDGIWDWCPATGEIQVNPRFFTMLGYAVGAVRTNYDTWSALIHPDDWARTEPAVRTNLGPESPGFAVEFRMRRASGEWCPVLARGKAVAWDPQGNPTRVCGSHFDLTERHRAEEALRAKESERAKLDEELRARQLELQRLSRVSALSGMASGLAHELSQPLAAARYTLNGCRALAEKGQLTAADAARAMSEALLATERASRIVEQMSQRSARRLGGRSTIDVAELLRTSIRLLSLDPELAGVTVSTRIADDLPTIMADPVQIEQVVINVLRNAIEATRKAGASREVQIEAASNRSEVVVVVQDSGPGFTVESLQRAFEPFYSSKGDGMGLGFSISQDIVQRHGGRIHARNNPAGGAIVEFTLPLSGMR
jgi:PAS domain S-box-containing protein